MVVQMLFGKRNVLKRYGTFAAFELNKFIYPNPTHLTPGRFSAAYCKSVAPPILNLAAD
jgi:hypothetical protein